MRQHPIVKSTDAGFTLIEFCLAVLIMTVGLLALLQSVNVALNHNLANTIRNEATALADEQMVAIKTSVVDTASFAAVAPAGTYLNRLSRNFFCNYSVITYVPTPYPSATSKEVDVKVVWRYKGTLYNHAISSLIVNPD